MPTSRVIPKRTPVSPGQDSRYTIRRNPDQNGQWWVYYKPQGIDRIPADEAHAELVERVNQLKEMEGNRPGGSFSINEYSQVIARMNAPSGYRGNAIHVVDISAGIVFEYHETITFLDGALDPSVTPEEGDAWPGPLCGTTYRFAAVDSPKLPSNNEDEVWISIDGEDVQLSAECGMTPYPPTSGDLALFLHALRRQLPPGGRFRVNEKRRAFTANTTRFIGVVPTRRWFRRLPVID
jgi:hypothetical protein